MRFIQSSGWYSDLHQTSWRSDDQVMWCEPFSNQSELSTASQQLWQKKTKHIKTRCVQRFSLTEGSWSQQWSERKWTCGICIICSGVKWLVLNVFTLADAAVLSFLKRGKETKPCCLILLSVVTPSIFKYFFWADGLRVQAEAAETWTVTKSSVRVVDASAAVQLCCTEPLKLCLDTTWGEFLQFLQKFHKWTLCALLCFFGGSQTSARRPEPFSFSFFFGFTNYGRGMRGTFLFFLHIWRSFIVKL